MSLDLDTIEKARREIAPFVLETPLLPAFELSEALGVATWLKHEQLQRTGSFKARGATCFVLRRSQEERARGFVTVSAGNHGLALVWAAARVGARATVLMPEDASPLKAESIRARGGEVVLHGEIQETLAEMERLADARDLVRAPPFDHLDVIAGQGTVGLEIAEQLPDADWVLVPVGGGGLLSGVAAAMAACAPHAKVVGVEAAGAPTLRHAWDTGGPAPLPSVATLAPSLGASCAGAHTYALSRRYAHDLVVVDEGAIAAALALGMTRGHVLLEPGAAVGIAALMTGAVRPRPDERVALVVSGGNLDLAILRSFLDR